MSSFSWLDYSEAERNKVLDLVNALGDRETRDELGIGTVRDAYADLLAPGTSTIQTRARYFFFIPWIYRNLERKLRSKRTSNKDEITRRARNDEIRLIDYLADSDDSDNTIGVDARKSLKRLPSSIYWNGLHVWGIRTFLGSQDQYHHTLQSSGPPPPLTKRTLDSHADSDKTVQNWHAGIPPAPKDFPYTPVSFSLTCEEADYLRERIMHKAPGTLLAFLTDEGRPCKKVKFPWEHPQVDELSHLLRGRITHAKNFSETIHGAALLYNHMLAEASEAEETAADYKQKFTAWIEMVESRKEHLMHWNIDEFWQLAYAINTRIPNPTKSFIDTWLNLALHSTDPSGLLDDKFARNLIRTRERTLKRGQARLFNPAALKQWRGAAGTARLDYRWGTVQTIIRDIQKPFTQDNKIA